MFKIGITPVRLDFLEGLGWRIMGNAVFTRFYVFYLFIYLFFLLLNRTMYIVTGKHLATRSTLKISCRVNLSMSTIRMNILGKYKYI